MWLYLSAKIKASGSICCTVLYTISSSHSKQCRLFAKLSIARSRVHLGLYIAQYFDIGHLTSGRFPKVATSDGHHFASEFPKKVQFLDI